MYLIGSIIRIYHDARSHEHQNQFYSLKFPLLCIVILSRNDQVRHSTALVILT